MVVAASVSLSRISGGPLLLENGEGTYRLSTIGRPSVSWRLGAAPDSADVHGTEYVSAAKQQSSLPLEVHVFAVSSSALAAAVEALTDALSQFSYEATVTVDGVARVWSCGPADYSYSGGAYDAGMVAEHMETLTITIPVYPIPGSV